MTSANETVRNVSGSRWADWELKLLHELFPTDVPRLMQLTGRSRDAVNHRAYVEGLAARGRTREDALPVPVLRDDGLRPSAVLRRQRQRGTKPRSTHRVHRGNEWLPCYCAADFDHKVGHEQERVEARDKYMARAALSKENSND